MLPLLHRAEVALNYHLNHYVKCSSHRPLLFLCQDPLPPHDLIMPINIQLNLRPPLSISPVFSIFHAPWFLPKMEKS